MSPFDTTPRSAYNRSMVGQTQRQGRRMSTLLLLIATLATAAACNGGSIDFATGTSTSTGTPTVTGSPTPTGTHTPTPTPTDNLVPGQTATSSAGTGTVLTASFPQMTQGSNMIAVAVGWNGVTGATAQITDDAGNSYFSSTGVKTSTGGNNVQVFFGPDARAAQTVTFTLSIAAPQSITIAEFSGRTRSNPNDGTSGASSTSADTSAASGPFVSPQRNHGDVVFGSAIHDGAAAVSSGAGFVLLGNVSNNGGTRAALAVEYQMLAGTSASATFGLTPADSWAAEVEGFRRGGGDN